MHYGPEIHGNVQNLHQCHPQKCIILRGRLQDFYDILMLTCTQQINVNVKMQIYIRCPASRALRSLTQVHLIESSNELMGDK